MTSIASVLQRWCGRGTTCTLTWTPQHPAVQAVRDQVGRLRKLGDGQLTAASAALRKRLQTPEHRGLETQIEAAALATEAVRRTRNLELFETQLLAGLVLAQGKVAEMQTGEGKTLAGALPIFYGALLGDGVHVMTSNAYLAERDAGILRPALKLLGVSVGLLEPRADAKGRQIAYSADVTFGAGYEFGFDYLRDQTALREHGSRSLGAELDKLLRGGVAVRPLLRQRGLARAVIDEVDCVLLDEGTVPLLLSGVGNERDDERPYRMAQKLCEQLGDGDFEVNRARAQVRLTEKGRWTIGSAQSMPHGLKLDRPWQDYVEKALLANHCFERDIQYVLVEEQVVIVDDCTGRLQADRSWKDGLHQAVEAKERLPLSPKNRTIAQISRQRFLRRYGVLCGMTGTVADSENELRETYGLDVIRIPTNRPCLRRRLPDRYFATTSGKWRAAVQEIVAVRGQGRPVLVGSRTIQASEAIARMLVENGVECRLLNGMQTADEAELIAGAGLRGVVTVATNMAGRGTDIRLGPGVAELGGLHVLGLERHSSARIDGQLAGRAARQGDPGSCRFFLSAEDALIREYAPELAKDMLLRAHADGEVRVDLAPQIRQVQTAAEEAARLRRRRLRDHDRWLGDTVQRLYGGD